MTDSKAYAEAASPAEIPNLSFDWQQIAIALLASKGINKGWWRFGMKLRFGALTTLMGDAGQVAVSLPTAIVGIESIVIFETTKGGELVFDAAMHCEPVPVGAVAPPSRPSRKKIVVRKKTT